MLQDPRLKGKPWHGLHKGASGPDPPQRRFWVLGRTVVAYSLHGICGLEAIEAAPVPPETGHMGTPSTGAQIL